MEDNSQFHAPGWHCHLGLPRACPHLPSSCTGVHALFVCLSPPPAGRTQGDIVCPILRTHVPRTGLDGGGCRRSRPERLLVCAKTTVNCTGSGLEASKILSGSTNSFGDSKTPTSSRPMKLGWDCSDIVVKTTSVVLGIYRQLHVCYYLARCFWR